MRSLLLSVILGCTLAGGCSGQARTTAPPPAPAPAPASAPPAAQGIATGEPHPGDPANAPGARPAAVTDADVAMAEKLLAVLVKLADGVARAGADCPAVAGAIRAQAPEVQALAAEAKQMGERLRADSAAEDWFEKTYGPKAMVPMRTLMGSSCMNDPAVSQAIQSLNF